MINSKLELQFYICADSMMNRGYFEKSLLMKVVSLIRPDWIMESWTALRKVAYYSNRGGVQRYYYKYRFRKLGMKLGFTISENVFGYGLVIPHYGTIVVGSGNRVGNYAVLHTSTCVTAGRKTIGDGFYLSTGAKVLGDIDLGNYTTIGANAVVNQSEGENCLLVGIPAKKKRDEAPWMKDLYRERYEACEELRRKLFENM